MKRKHLLALMLVVLLLVVGCTGKQGLSQSPSSPQVQDSPQTLAWRTLMTNKQVYDATFQALALLDKQGKLPAKVKAKVIKLGNVYLSAHNQAVQALLDGKMPSMDTVKAALDAYLVYSGPYAQGVK